MICNCGQKASINIAIGKDLKKLEIPLADYLPKTVKLCASCTASYMNDFNNLFAIKFNKPTDYVWTEQLVNELLRN